MFLFYVQLLILTQSQDKATEANLLNLFGVPDYQVFASYGYSTTMHTDNEYVPEGSTLEMDELAISGCTT